MRTALVSGHRGFVGSHLTRALVADGWEVTGCDNDGAPADLLCDCREFFAETTTRFDLVVHCAAVVGGRMTISGDPMAVAVDLELDAAMFRWAVRTRQPRVVYFSSCAAYPTALQVEPNVCREEDLTLTPTIGTPDLTYGWAKITGEMLAGYAQAEGVRVHIFRPFSGYGDDQDPCYPFPAFVNRAAHRQNPFTVWGDGTAVRDFVHIDDIVATVLTVIEGEDVGPLNIGTGRATSFNELQRLVCAAAGYDPAVQHALDRPVGPSWRQADVTLLNRIRPAEVTLEEGIRRALRSHPSPGGS